MGHNLNTPIQGFLKLTLKLDGNTFFSILLVSTIIDLALDLDLFLDFKLETDTDYVLDLYALEQFFDIDLSLVGDLIPFLLGNLSLSLDGDLHLTGQTLLSHEGVLLLSGDLLLLLVDPPPSLDRLSPS